MTFNSLLFLIFALVVFPLYWISGHRTQNRLLLAASLFFYGSWDWRFLSLLLVTIVVDYTCGRQIARSGQIRKRFYLLLSIVSNLGMLGFFKYFNFFQENLIRIAAFCGIRIDPWVLHVILPVGISFYTFQSMSYVIDVYRGQTPPAQSLPDFALFVSYFPQLVAGPIERVGNLLPQLKKERQVTRAQFYEGSWLILWGLYKKAYVADHLAKLVAPVFSKSAGWTGAEVLLALYAFAFQIYGDFSGYSDMARGLAKLMGVELMINFGMPYGVTSPREFWRHWHISLSEWVRDYVYIPLGGNRGGEMRLYCNLMLALLAGGLWHGAGWTFVVWGLYHGLLLCGQKFWELHGPRRQNNSKAQPGWLAFLQGAVIFHLVCLGWLFFRADSLGQCAAMFKALLFNFGTPSLHTLFYLAAALWFFAIIAVLAKPFEGGLVVFRWPWWARGLVYFAVFYSTVIFGAFDGRQFIYFQF